MGIQLRPIREDEYMAFGRAAGLGFSDHSDEAQLEKGRPIFEFDRSLAAFEGEDIVGTGLIMSFELTLPGGSPLRAGGVTWIAVLPTHRRRGILTGIMRQQLRDMRERGEPVGLLYASESNIYGRFGYGVSTIHAKYTIDTRYRQLIAHPDFSGQVRIVDKETARRVLPGVYERARPLIPGALSRTDAWWDYYLRDLEHHRDGMTARFYATYESRAGEIDGYVAYRTKHNWESGFPMNTLGIMQMITVNDEARAALWSYLLHVDLMSQVEWWSAPIDEPLKWMLAEPRRLRVSPHGDSLWTRMVDIPAALAERRYGREDRLVFEVEDRFCPENSGRYRLEGSPDGATAARTDAEPDLALEVADLGGAYLGGVRFSNLARAGRVRECTPGALRRADLLFWSEPLPWCTTDF